MRKLAADHGAVSVEYTLLAIFIAVVAAVGIALLGGFVDGLFNLGSDAVPGP